MRKYSVRCEKGSENSFVSLSNYEEILIEFLDFDEEGNELYEIETEYDIDRLLDLSPGVVEYSVETTDVH